MAERHEAHQANLTNKTLQATAAIRQMAQRLVALNHADNEHDALDFLFHELFRAAADEGTATAWAWLSATVDHNKGRTHTGPNTMTTFNTTRPLIKAALAAIISVKAANAADDPFEGLT